ncbi:hypothetical protein ACLB2K_055687 [Fragaria x ananassa]
MTSRRTNSNTSATINPRLAYPPPPPSTHDNPYEYYFPSPPPPSLSSPLNHLSPYDYFSIDDTDDVNDHWHFENPARPLSNSIQITRVRVAVRTGLKVRTSVHSPPFGAGDGTPPPQKTPAASPTTFPSRRVRSFLVFRRDHPKLQTKSISPENWKRTDSLGRESGRGRCWSLLGWRRVVAGAGGWRTDGCPHFKLSVDVTRTRRPFEGAIGAARLPDFASLLAPPGSRIHAVLLDDPRTRQILSGQWTPAAPRQEADSRLTYNEQKKALQKLRKEIYNPLRRISPTVNLYYRGTVVDSNKERNDNGKSCAICLEDFEPKQEVMLTPCKHMFHEECIVPWVKSSGRCPVCRFGISD